MHTPPLPIELWKQIFEHLVLIVNPYQVVRLRARLVMRFLVKRMKREGPLQYAVESAVGWLKVEHTRMSADGMFSASGTSSKYWTDYGPQKIIPLSTKMTIERYFSKRP